jgi:hypothetical protein
MDSKHLWDTDVPVPQDRRKGKSWAMIAREMPTGASILMPSIPEAGSMKQAILNTGRRCMMRKRVLARHGEQGCRLWALSKEDVSET